MAKPARKKSANTYRVDFTGVEAGGGGRLLPEDTYLFEIKEVEFRAESEASGQPYFKFTLAVAEGPYAGTRAWDNFSMQHNSLWKMRGLMELLDMEVIDGSAMDIVGEDFEGILVQAEVEHEDYQGKTRHKIRGYLPAEAESKEETRAAAATSSVRKKKPAKKVEEEEEEEPAVVWSKKQKVTFMDGKKKVSGVISDVNGDAVTVRVGSDEYEVSADDLEAA